MDEIRHTESTEPRRNEALFAQRLKVEQLGELSTEVASGMNSLLDEVIRYEDSQEELLRLVPTEGRLSEAAKSVMTCVMAGRYLHAPPENQEKAIRYPDIAPLQNIFDICRGQLKQILRAEFVNVEPVSGLQAMDITLKAFAQPGELVLTLSPAHGGHLSTQPKANRLGCKVEFLPFDCERHVIDVSRLDGSKHPALIYVDHSNILRPHDLQTLKAFYPNAVLCFDISQVFAPVAGGVFPNPLEGGADIIVGSTHKSLNGPQKACAASNNRKIMDLFNETATIEVSNNHPGDVAALAMTLLEFRAFGSAYAHQLVANANALAKALHQEGLSVYLFSEEAPEPYTFTPHLWLDSTAQGLTGEVAAQRLFREAGIVVNTLYLPLAGPDASGALGLRLPL